LNSSLLFQKCYLNQHVNVLTEIYGAYGTGIAKQFKKVKINRILNKFSINKETYK